MIRVFNGRTFFSFRGHLSINAFYVDIVNSVSKMPEIALYTCHSSLRGQKTGALYQLILLSVHETLLECDHIFAQFVHARDAAG